MPSTPKRAGASAPEGSRFPSEVLAANVQAYRGLRRLSQDALAALMNDLGHRWGRTTLSQVERCGRSVDVDELVSLALALGATIGDLLDPAGPDGFDEGGLYVGTGELGRVVVPQPEARAIAHSISAVVIKESLTLTPDDPNYEIQVRDRGRFRRWLGQQEEAP